LLYSGPWVSERYAAVGEFLSLQSEGINEVVRKIIIGATKYSAADAYKSAYQLEALKQRAAKEWALMDVLLLPTAGTIYRKEAVAGDPMGLNGNLGFYTNFVNLMDLAAGPRASEAMGCRLASPRVGRAFSDEALLALSARYLGEPPLEKNTPPGCVLVAVVGAHLEGQT